LVAAVALAFGNFVAGFAATVGGKGTADLDTFLELAGRPATDVPFGFASVDELTSRGFTSASGCAPV